MKIILTIVFLFLSTSVQSQSIQEIDQQLTSTYNKIEYWNEYDNAKDNIAKDDSLDTALEHFEQQLLHYTTAVPQTLDYPFKSLVKKGVTIATSEDGLFRIYSWYLYNGGTMHFYKNIFQFRNRKGTFAYISATTNADDIADPGCFYRKVNKVESPNKTFYITQSTMIGSSALTYHAVKIFSIEDYGLNDTAKLIKTKTGIRNKLGHEMDFSTSANRDSNRSDINYGTEYDADKKIITIPLLNEDGKLTTKKIRYHFNGKYFVKM